MEKASNADKSGGQSKYDVYISCARNRGNVVEAVKKLQQHFTTEQLKFTPSFGLNRTAEQDQAIDLSKEEEAAINESAVFILCINDDYAEMPKAYAEAMQALEGNKLILPLRVQADVAEKKLLRWWTNYQKWIDFYNDDLIAKNMPEVAEFVSKYGVSTRKTACRLFGKVPECRFYTDRPNYGTKLQDAVRSLVKSADGNKRTLLVHGEAGIGKTWLVAMYIREDIRFLEDINVKTIIWLNVRDLEVEPMYRELANLAEPNSRTPDLQTFKKFVTDAKNQQTLVILDDLVNSALFVGIKAFGVPCLVTSRFSTFEGSVAEEVVKTRLQLTANDDEKSLCLEIFKQQAPNVSPGLLPIELSQLTRLFCRLPLLASSMSNQFKAPDEIKSRLQGSLLQLARELKPGIETVDKILLREIFKRINNADFMSRSTLLLIFRPEQPIAVTDLAILWNCPENKVNALAVNLCDQSVLRSSTTTHFYVNSLVHASLRESALRSAKKDDDDFFPDILGETLLKVGCNDKGENVLHQAAAKQRSDLITAIRENDAKLLLNLCSQQDRNSKETPLHYLLQQENWYQSQNTAFEENVALRLLCLICEKLAAYNKEKALQMLQTKSNRTKRSVIEMFFEKSTASSSTNANPFLFLAKIWGGAFMKLLLENTDKAKLLAVVDANKQNTALHIAAMNSNELGLRVLLENGAKVNQANKDGATAIMLALKSGDHLSTKILLQFNPDLTAVDKEGNSVVMHAAGSRNPDCLKLIFDVQRDLDVNRSNLKGENALELAIKANSLQNAEFLIGQRAVLQLSRKKSVLKFLRDANHSQMIVLLDKINWTGQVEETGGNCDLARKSEIVDFLKKSSKINPRDLEQAVQFALEVGLYKNAEFLKKAMLLPGAYQQLDVDITTFVQDPANDASIKSVYKRDKVNSFKGVLLPAAKNGCLTDVTVYVLKYQVDFVKQKDEQGNTALLLASEKGHAEIVSLLVQKGACINDRDKSGETALIKASRYGYVEIIRALSFNAVELDPNMANNDGKTALHLVCESNTEFGDCVETLLNVPNLDVNLKSKNGWTPLHNAVKFGHAKIVRLLLEHSAVDLNAKTNTGLTALILATLAGNSDLIELMCRYEADVNSQSESEFTALISACTKGDIDLIQLLLRHGASVRRANIDGETPMSIAVQQENEKLVKLLAPLKAPIRLEHFKDNHTALMEMAKLGNVKIFDWLIEAHVDVNEVTLNDGRAALMFACESDNEGHLQIVSTLLQNGADLNKQDKAKGFTALMTALNLANERVVELLLNKALDRIDLSTVAAEGTTRITAMMIAIMKSSKEIVKKLAEAGAPLGGEWNGDKLTPLMLASIAGRSETVAWLIDGGADVNATSQVNLMTPLMYACEENDQDWLTVVRTLIQKGADLNKQRKGDGYTALMIAAHYGNQRVVEAILELPFSGRLDWNLVASDGKTVVDIAKQRNQISIGKTLDAFIKKQGIKLATSK